MNVTRSTRGLRARAREDDIVRRDGDPGREGGGERGGRSRGAACGRPIRVCGAWSHCTLGGASTGVGVAAARCPAMARDIGIELPFFGLFPKRTGPRIFGPLGNPTVLNVSMMKADR